jgi:hypothetical protein
MAATVNRAMNKNAPTIDQIKIGRDYYLSHRQPYAPQDVRLVIVAESPPKNGTYIYDRDGRTSEWLFAALMKQLRFVPKTKDEGLRELQKKGWVLVDATYQPVDGEKNNKKRDEVILRDYPLLKTALEKMLADKSVPIVLIKVNVCDALEPKLKADGFNVINNGIRVSFPSHGRQPDFHRQFGAVLKSAGISSLP